MPRHNPEAVKTRLKAKGWTHRRAAEHLGLSFEHVNRVLNGHRESRRLLRELDALPKRPKPVSS